jgi:thiosulfate/3-mercaptopyruvate sulfurtransferase
MIAGRLTAISALALMAFVELRQSMNAADKLSSSTYGRNELVIEAHELKKLPSRPEARIVLDVRPLEKFQELHFNDAVHIDAADWSKGFGDGLNSGAWGRRFGEIGIGPDTEVIVYDDRAGQDAARIWWYLKYWGVNQARLVNGGWRAIQAQGLPTARGAGRLPTATPFSSTPLATRRIDLASLVAAHKAGRLGTDDTESLQLLDVRSEKEFRGEQITEGLRPGTIPGARHLEWSDLVDSSTDCFLPTAEVVTLLKARGIELNRPVVAFSNTRGRSLSIAFPLELAGVIQTRIFDAGLKAWASDPNNPLIVQKP